MEHGLKDIAFYVQNAYNTLHSCHNFPAGSRQATRGARVCETSLFCCMPCTGQFGGPVRKATGRVTYTPPQLGDKSPWSQTGTQQGAQ